MKNLCIDNFVVYAYSRIDGTFYYIGKGKPRRPYSKHRNVRRPADLSRIHILKEGLSEKEAFDMEKTLIKMYGRKDKHGFGVLRNMTDGGEGATGFSKETLEKISGKNHPFYKSRNWCHVEYGFEGNISASELAKKYKSDNLLSSSLSNLAKKKINEHKGWIYVEWEDIERLRGEVKIEEFFNQEYAKNKIKFLRLSKAEKVKGSKHHASVKRSWCHITRGFVGNKSNCELIRDYPEDNLETSCLSSVALKKSHSHKGWIYIDLSEKEEVMTDEELKEVYTAEYASKKISSALSSAIAKISGSSNKNYIKRNWCHTAIGFVANTSASDLVKMYPELKLDYKALCSVAMGKRRYHKGVIFLSQDLIDEVSSKGQNLKEKFSGKYAQSEIERLKKEIKDGQSGKNNPSYKQMNWVHPEHGHFNEKSASELIKMFPNLKLHSSGFSRVISGVRSSYRGWKTTEE